MRIFVLEDNEERISTLKKQLPVLFPNLEVEFATEAEEAKEKLEKATKFNLILLDHDLGGRVFVPSLDNNTGFQVALFIRDKKIEYDLVVIHSMNPAGAENIQAVLPDSVHAPFPILVNYLRGIKEA